MFGRKAIGRPDASNVFGCQWTAGANVLGNKQRAPEIAAGGFALAHAVAYGSERSLSRADGLDHVFEFVRLERKRAIGSRRSARERDVLFDNAGAKRHGRDRDRNA